MSRVPALVYFSKYVAIYFSFHYLGLEKKKLKSEEPNRSRSEKWYQTQTRIDQISELFKILLFRELKPNPIQTKYFRYPNVYEIYLYTYIY